MHLKTIRLITGITFSPLIALYFYSLCRSLLELEFNLPNLNFLAPTSVQWAISWVLILLLLTTCVFFIFLLLLSKKFKIKSVLSHSILGMSIAATLSTPIFLTVGNIGNIILAASSGFLTAMFYSIISAHSPGNKSYGYKNIIIIISIIVALVLSQEFKFTTDKHRVVIADIKQTHHSKCIEDSSSEFCKNRSWLYKAKSNHINTPSAYFEYNLSLDCKIGDAAIVGKNGTLVNHLNNDYMSYKIISCKNV